MLKLTAVTVLFSYIFSSAAYGLFAIRHQHGLQPNWKPIGLAIVGVACSIWLFIGSEAEAIELGSYGILAGLPIYLWKKYAP